MICCRGPAEARSLRPCKAKLSGKAQALGLGYHSYVEFLTAQLVFSNLLASMKLGDRVAFKRLGCHYRKWATKVISPSKRPYGTMLGLVCSEREKQWATGVPLISIYWRGCVILGVEV